MTSSVHVSSIGDWEYHTDEHKVGYGDDAKEVEFISSILFRNSGRTIFGSVPHYQEITLSDEKAIDELIEMLTFAKMHFAHNLFLNGVKGDNLLAASLRCKNECKAFQCGEGYRCDFCGEVTEVKYGTYHSHDGDYDYKPAVCAGCGAVFKSYIDERQTEHFQVLRSDGELLLDDDHMRFELGYKPSEKSVEITREVFDTDKEEWVDLETLDPMKVEHGRYSYSFDNPSVFSDSVNGKYSLGVPSKLFDEWDDTKRYRFRVAYIIKHP